MTRKLHLEARHKREIERLIKHYLPDVEVWAYGSRTNGRSHEASDLDLVLRTHDLTPVNYKDYLALKEALDESSIPILVEIRDWARLPESFHGEIEKGHVVFIGEG